jgi:hypothetical protein
VRDVSLRDELIDTLCSQKISQLRVDNQEPEKITEGLAGILSRAGDQHLVSELRKRLAQNWSEWKKDKVGKKVIDVLGECAKDEETCKEICGEFVDYLNDPAITGAIYQTIWDALWKISRRAKLRLFKDTDAGSTRIEELRQASNQLDNVGLVPEPNCPVESPTFDASGLLRLPVEHLLPTRNGLGGHIDSD